MNFYSIFINISFININNHVKNCFKIVKITLIVSKKIFGHDFI